MSDIPVIDTHCHASLRWFDPVESLLFHMDLNGVERAVLIGNLYEYDRAADSYQQRCFHAHADRLQSVALIDPSKSDALELLAEYVDDGIVGVRLRADERSLGEDPLEFWRAVDAAGLVVSCLGANWSLATPEFQALVEELPNLTMVLEHLAMVPNSPSTDEQRQAVWSLAKYPNLFIKVPALSLFAERDLPYKSMYPFKTPVPQYLQEVFEIWGPDRMMWGSDFPPVTAREGYAHALQFPRDELSDKPLEAQRKIFSETAERVFRFKK